MCQTRHRQLSWSVLLFSLSPQLSSVWLYPYPKSCQSGASDGPSNASPRDVKETEHFEDGVRRIAFGFRMLVLREGGCQLDLTQVPECRDSALQVLQQDFTFVQQNAPPCRPGFLEGRPRASPGPANAIGTEPSGCRSSLGL